MEVLKMSQNSNLVSLIAELLHKTKGEIKIHSQNVEKSELIINEILSGLQNHERPDAFTLTEDVCYILEHFEFDSAGSNRKGSTLRAESARIERTHKEITGEAVKNPPTNNDGVHEVTFQDEYNITHSAGNYIKNALLNAQNHYDKIDEYIPNLKDSMAIGDKLMKVGFFIEDKTLLGNMHFKRDKENPFGKTTPVYLCNTKQFLDWFEQAEKLDFCFCSSNHGMSHIVWYIDRGLIEEYRKHEIDMDISELIDFQPKVHGFSVIFDEGEKQ